MSNLDFSGLSDLPTEPAGPKGWTPLSPAMLGYGGVLCFDQSLTATGTVILLNADPNDAPSVHSARMWKDEHEGKTVLTSLKRGVDVFGHARETIRHRPFWVDSIVHESPPNPAAVKGGGYSSLLAAQALWCAAKAEGVEVEMLGSQPAKKLVCGNANAKKTEVHKVLRETVLPWIVNSQIVTNEATRDALMVGLLKLARTPR